MGSFGQALTGGLSGASAGAGLGSIIPGIGTALGAGIGAITGFFGNLFGGNSAEEDFDKQKELMGLQYEYNEKAADANAERAYEMWEKTNYQAQVQQLEKAGLNAGLIYGQGGGMQASTAGGTNAGVSAQQSNYGQLLQQQKIMNVELGNKQADTILKLAQAEKEKGEAEKKGVEKSLLETEQNLKQISIELANQQKEINANTITEGAATAAKAASEMVIAATDAEIKQRTKETVISQTMQTLYNSKVEGALNILKGKNTEANTKLVEEQIKWYMFDIMTGRITAEAAAKNAESTAKNIINQYELGDRKLKIEDERLLKDWIYGGADALTKGVNTITEIIPVGKILKLLNKTK